MADKDPEGDRPSLELPSFGFGRRKRRDRTEASDPEVPALPDPGPLDRPTEVLPPVVPAKRRPRPVAATAPSRAASRGVDTPADVRIDEPEIEPATRERRDLHFPSLPALPAVLVVGAVVGLAAVLLTWGSLRLCDVATGTASCGGGPGLLLLVAILIALTYLGGWLLRGFGISDAGSTSFLAVGLLAVVAMLFLVDSLDSWTGAVAVPVVTVVAYALSWRVTAKLVDAGADQQ
ncbi:hypothetical protein [Nocardioides terrigena]|uniref:hypothetical protein n=1 Tax=Nocardioides terrigena TaxID=424797 RepID=UPI000D3200AF|nr:hypothetical protein [Nocardioides terrigena]